MNRDTGVEKPQQCVLRVNVPICGVEHLMWLLLVSSLREREPEPRLLLQACDVKSQELTHSLGEERQVNSGLGPQSEYSCTYLCRYLTKARVAPHTAQAWLPEL